ncbi:MAG: amidohydrolase family protein [Polyangiaceae bacterium]|jgi:imidazolonepropionase-like amidohydrolase|nr:amidohydrolase family protein [Polyangiaceae bacterium]
MLHWVVAPLGFAEAAQPGSVIFENVRVFDGRSDRLSAPSNVLVVGNVIKSISTTPIADSPGTTVSRIAGGGRTLMPGLIDAHTHIMFSTLPQHVILTSDAGYISVAATKAASDTLMRGFTSIRDLGGPVLGLKRGIDNGMVAGPRIWPAGAFISQTGGHGDFRLPNELPAAPGSFSFSERIGAAAIADNPDAVRQRAREQLALGASQIKLMAGGGVASSYDPLDVTQYTVPELRAAVEAAENWGTYVTVHAYTPRAIAQAIEAGVRCIDHGQLLDEPTARLMADKGVWWSLQPFTDDQPSAFAEGSPNRLKQLEMFSGTDTAYGLAKRFKIKTAWGTDILFSAENAAKQGANLAKMVRWYTPAEILKMATADNAALLALSGPRSPYAGKLGVVEEGALADLLLVDGDPLANIELVADPAKTFLVIMKDGKIYKNLLHSQEGVAVR